MIELCEATEENPFIHGMSKPFVVALEQLFDVMDTENVGTIRYSDLSAQWEEDQSDPFFPRGLLTCLAKVTLPNGLLTFDRFCAGVKLCLLKNQVELADSKNVESGDIDECKLTLPLLKEQLTEQKMINDQSLVPPEKPPLMLERPSSEPQIYAPPPPPSVMMSSSLTQHQPVQSPEGDLNNNQATLCNQNSTVTPRNSSFIGPSTASTSSATNISDDAASKSSSTTKKLPLPSYEQVMAAKCKSTPKLLPEMVVQTATVPNHKQHHQQPKFAIVDQTSNTILPSGPINRLAPISLTNTIPPENVPLLMNKPPPPPPPPPPVALVEDARFRAKFGIQENYNSFFTSAPGNHSVGDIPYHRAKSMNHLDSLSSHPHLMSSNVPTQISEQFATSAAKTDLVGGQQVKNSTTTSELSNKQLSPTSTTQSTHSINRMGHQPKTLSRNYILKTLQSWRDNILHHKQVVVATESTNKNNISLAEVDQVNGGGGSGSGGGNLQPHLTGNGNPMGDGNSHSLTVSSLRRNVPKRREPRRHTVGANGVDFYSIKRFQQLQQEKDILLRGLSEVDITKEWYLRQVANIQEKLALAGKSGSFPASDCNLDAHQERINFQAARIQNLNQHLIALREAAHTFPLHMNLAIRPLTMLGPSTVTKQPVDPNQPKQLVINPNLVNKLKEQNRLLTEEVSRKSDRITQLEREKASLIRELFQARTYSSYYNGDLDDTFM